MKKSKTRNEARAVLAAADGNALNLAELEVAVIHYWFVTWRGGEKVIESLLKLFPKADIYTLFYDEAKMKNHLQGHEVQASVINTPFLRKHHQKVFPLYPKGVQSLKLKKKYDLILSSESGPAKGIPRGKLNQNTPHLCYVHTPMRYCYGFERAYLEPLPFLLRNLAANRLVALRKWDETTVDNVDAFLANSVNVQERIRRFWRKEAKVCYPPIELDLFMGEVKPLGGEYYLSFGALTPYKKVDLLVQAFNQTGKPLVVIGEGSEKAKLKAAAKDNIRFVGYQSLEKVKSWIQGAKALLFAGEEDFGMIPLEAMAQGLPVIAYKAGGVLETVVENRQQPDKSSGIFFLRQEAREVNQALEDFEQLEAKFDPIWIRSHARGFGEDAFLVRFTQLVKEFMEQRP